jgi:RNA polymerase sigma factor (TIGR02999 family)
MFTAVDSDGRPESWPQNGKIAHILKEAPFRRLEVRLLNSLVEAYPMTDTDNITQLLSDLHAGDKDVISQLLPAVRSELRRIANLHFKNEHGPRLFDPSDLVQDASLRLLFPGVGPFNDREHFFAVASITVRRRLIELGRAARAKKRGGREWARVEMDEALPAGPENWGELLDVDQALHRLEVLNPRQSRVVEMRVFAGMTVEEIAKTLGVCPATVKSDWAVAAAFLRRELNAYGDAPAVGTN